MKTRIFTLSILFSLIGFGCGLDDSEISTDDHHEHENQYDDYNDYTDQDWDNSADAGYYEGADDEYYPEPPPEEPTVEQPEEQDPEFEENEFISTAEENTSTFSIDVNTASYTMMRRDLNQNNILPEPNSVRTEEFVNFFRFQYPNPVDAPFSINMEVAPSYFGTTEDIDRHLLRIGVRGKDVSIEDMKSTNLVFLVDVSGSMSSSNKLPLAQESLHVMLDHLRPTDRVAIQTYASGSITVLDSTPVSERASIEDAIDSLYASGATNGEGGIIDAYNLAEDGFIEGGNNRVIILSDGDMNVGKTGTELVDFVREYRDREISLTAIGLGQGGYNDRFMEQLVRDANGNYFYIDTIEEGRRIFGSDLPSTIEVIAADVKIQVEFASDVVDRYRLIGYEKRILDNQDFDNDLVDAGEIGPGHTVTALYELELHTDAPLDAPYLAEVRIRHKSQYGEDSELLENIIKMNEVLDNFAEASGDFRFAAAVVEFAAILRHSQFVDEARFNEVHTIADEARDPDYDEQSEFLELITIAEDLWE